MTATESEYKGKPILVLQDEDMKYPVKFGVYKAKAFVKYAKEIKEWIESQKS